MVAVSRVIISIKQEARVDGTDGKLKLCED